MKEVELLAPAGDIEKLKLLFLNFYFLNLSPFHHLIYIFKSYI